MKKRIQRFSRFFNYFFISLIIYIFSLIFLPIIFFFNPKLTLSFINIFDPHIGDFIDKLLLSNYSNTFSCFFFLLIFLFIAVLLVSKINRKKTLNENGLIYINCPYWLQFEVYKHQYLHVNLQDYEESDDKVSIFFRENNGGDTANIILEDTFPINEKTQLPKNVHQNDTFEIKRSSSHERTINHDFIKKVEITIDKIRSKGYKNLNVFASVNPYNAKQIIKDNFMKASRDRHLNVYIFQDESETHKYLKGHRIE